MSLIDNLLMALQNDNDDSIKQFKNFKIISKLGKGQQGVVLKIKNNIDKCFALKFYQPTDTDPTILNKSIARFINEINILSSLNHKNIVNIYTGGFAKWENDNWIVTEGFQQNVPSILHSNEVFFYIMEYIEGFDLNEIFPVLTKNYQNTNTEENVTIDILSLFENLIHQVSKAMIYYHEKQITHKDIKPENIRFRVEDSTFIIVDFGFSHHVSSPQDVSIIERTDYIDFPSIKTNDFIKNDMGQFSQLLDKILPTLKSYYHNNRYFGILSAINKGKHSDLSQRFPNISDFYNTVKQYFIVESGWRFQLNIDEYLTSSNFGRFDSKLRIPVTGSILLCSEVRELIDTQEFQRLRGIRQLGPTMFVFPGATHTRFEHSLGVYSLALKYLEKLLTIAEFKIASDPIDKTIKQIILSALFHDIGHYPYSHWIEEIDTFPNDFKLPSHETRATVFLESPRIKDIIENIWGISTADIGNIINNKSENELVNSFINSVIDIDKLDYLTRDSVHCGINYGKGIDTERILDSLFISKETNKLCLTEKGRSALLSILATRNIMYQEVYWHKTVRACESMFKRFFYEFLSQLLQKGHSETLTILEPLFLKSDDEFISYLYEWSLKNKNQNLTQLIEPFAYKGRSNIYKPAYIYFEKYSKEKVFINNFFSRLFDDPYSVLISKSQKLSELLKEYIPDIGPFDILFEKTPIKTEGERYLLQGFKLYNTRKKDYFDHPSEIDALNEYLNKNRQAYIFCLPKHYEKLTSLFNDDKTKLQSILTNI